MKAIDQIEAEDSSLEKQMAGTPGQKLELPTVKSLVEHFSNSSPTSIAELSTSLPDSDDLPDFPVEQTPAPPAFFQQFT